MPMAAFTQIVAAVVRPWTSCPLRRMAPAPRNPSPETTCAAARSGVPTAAPSSTDRIAKSADPSAMSIFVLSPAGLWRYSRSSPIAPPSAAARTSRRNSSEVVVGFTRPYLPQDFVNTPPRAALAYAVHLKCRVTLHEEQPQVAGVRRTHPSDALH